METKLKVISRIQGGLGNQLFCYAAARRLALVNNAELVIDDVTGFVRDHQFQRKYSLDNFNITVRKAKPAERLEPFERYRRWVKKWLARWKPFPERHYLKQEGVAFDRRLLELKVKGTLFLDGLWQSENYFKDVEQNIRNDLQIIPPTDELNNHMAKEISNKDAVALHVRWFSVLGSTGTYNVPSDYYNKAIDMMEKRITSPHYFIFSDEPDAVRAKISLPEGRTNFISHNHGNDNACADLWLMTKCKHFIIANSTFSWWGAWLGEAKEKIVLCPKPSLIESNLWARIFSEDLPRKWQRI